MRPCWCIPRPNTIRHCGVSWVHRFLGLDYLHGPAIEVVCPELTVVSCKESAAALVVLALPQTTLGSAPGLPVAWGWCEARGGPQISFGLWACITQIIIRPGPVPCLFMQRPPDRRVSTWVHVWPRSIVQSQDSCNSLLSIQLLRLPAFQHTRALHHIAQPRACGLEQNLPTLQHHKLSLT